MKYSAVQRSPHLPSFLASALWCPFRPSSLLLLLILLFRTNGSYQYWTNIRWSESNPKSPRWYITVNTLFNKCTFPSISGDSTILNLAQISRWLHLKKDFIIVSCSFKTLRPSYCQSTWLSHFVIFYLQYVKWYQSELVVCGHTCTHGNLETTEPLPHT